MTHIFPCSINLLLTPNFIVFGMIKLLYLSTVLLLFNSENEFVVSLSSLSDYCNKVENDKYKQNIIQLHYENMPMQETEIFRVKKLKIFS